MARPRGSATTLPTGRARRSRRITVTWAVVPGPHGAVRVRWYEPVVPAVSDASPPLIWVHGGGFVAGGLWHPESFATGRALARAGVPVMSVGYRLVKGATLLTEPSPKRLESGVRYPIPLDDVLAAIASVGDRHYLLGGASAGACLAAAATLKMLRIGGNVPEAVFLAYGTFHAVLPEPSAELAATLHQGVGRVHFREDNVFNMNLGYAGSRERMRDPFVFPGGHDLTGFPPTFLLDADRDSLRASGEAFAAELRAAGVAVDHRIVPGTLHGFLARTWMPAYRTGIATVIGWALRAERASVMRAPIPDEHPDGHPPR
ncbi:MAG TPA: alpha/beta hydrolase [Candidatus Lumbricidophila sp.]|nr:alpha/beta hydrolase [Candidatus Lumbricidophila sp.]